MKRSCSGHRRDLGSIEAEIPYTPCIIRTLNDDQAIQQMVEDNVNNREISTMELARALKMQLDAIKHQGARSALQTKDYASGIEKRSNGAIPEEHKSSIDMGRDLLRRAYMLVVCGNTVDEAVKNDIAIAGRLNITATILDGILTVKGQGRKGVASNERA